MLQIEKEEIMSKKKETVQTQLKAKMTVDQVVREIKRISALLDKEPSQVKFRELVENGLSERQMARFGGLGILKKAHFPNEDKALGDIKNVKNQNKYITKLENELASKELFEKNLNNVLSSLKPIKFKNYKVKKKKTIKRALNVVLSDLHIGSDINKEETGKLDFGKVEEARRLARIVSEIIEYKPQYRNETELHVNILGDIIENKLHDLGDDSAPVAEQAARAIYLLTQALAHLSAHFPKVTVNFQTGNHGRNTGRHHTRAVSQKWDSIETIVYYAIKNSLANNKNIIFNLPLTPYLIYEVFGHKIFTTHGDSVLNVGYPGTAIKTGSLEDQVNRINASLADDDEIAVFIVGHVHVGSITHLSNGATLLTNGAMVPANAFAVSIGQMETACGQWIFESVENYPCGDQRYIRVSEKDDKDSSLDNIISPWKAL